MDKNRGNVPIKMMASPTTMLESIFITQWNVTVINLPGVSLAWNDEKW